MAIRTRLLSLGPWAIAGLLAGALEFASPPPVAASLVSRVTITSKEMHTNECLDPWCSTPDLFAVAWVVPEVGRPVRCGIGNVTQDVTDVVQDEILCSGLSVEGRFQVRFEVWDQDGTISRDGEQATLGSWPEKGFTTGFIAPSKGFSMSFTSSPGPSIGIFTVDTKPAVPSFVFDGANTKAFDPQAGERATISGWVSDRSRLRVAVDVPGGTLILAEDVFPGGGFRAVWDGRGFSGAPVPAGDYDVVVSDVSAPTGTTMTTARTKVTVAAAPPRLRFGLLLPARPDGWEFSAGPITVEASASHPGAPVFTAAPGGCADQLPAERTMPLGPVAAGGPFQFDWDGLNDYGYPIGWGRYCLTLSGPSGQGPYEPSRREIDVLPRPTGIEVIASLSPIAPALQTATLPEIHAFAVDSEHHDRYAFSMTLTIAAAPAGGGAAPFDPITVTQTCDRASYCSWPLPPTLATSRAVVWRVDAAEAPDFAGRPGPTATTGFRITDLMPSGSAPIRVDVPALVVKRANGDVDVLQAAPSQTLDIAYYPGTGLAAGDPSGGMVFPLAIESAVNELRGFGRIERLRQKSSVFDNWDRAAVWAVPEPVAVDAAGDQTCRWQGRRSGSFAESVGVLHSVGCRDRTPGVEFSSKYPRVGVAWHEFHHSAYDEWDEYCCDGGYHESVNVYTNQASCQANSSNPGSCHPIVLRDIRTGQVMQTLPWWASDPDKFDVMGETNDFENADDRRAAKRTFDRCRSGGC